MTHTVTLPVTLTNQDVINVWWVIKSRENPYLPTDITEEDIRLVYNVIVEEFGE